jgi:hypothetical protein
MGSCIIGVFWESFARCWSVCDDTWDYLPELLELLRPHRRWAPARRFLGRRSRVYRGCDQSEIRGISWSTSRAVAEKFAHGHRGIRSPNPESDAAVPIRGCEMTIVPDDSSLTRNACLTHEPRRRARKGPTRWRPVGPAAHRQSVFSLATLDTDQHENLDEVSRPNCQWSGRRRDRECARVRCLREARRIWSQAEIHKLYRES